MVLKKIPIFYFVLLALLLPTKNAISEVEKITLSNGHQFCLKAFAKRNSLPTLVIANSKDKTETIVKFGESEPDIFSYQSSLHFRIYNIQGLPNPIIMAVAAAPGRSDTVFITKLLTFNNGQPYIINNSGWKTLIEGGIFIGNLPNQSGQGVIVWNFIWGNNESHSDPHRYQINIYRWNGVKLVQTEKLITRKPYDNGLEALKEFKIDAADFIARDFALYNQYR